MFALPTALTKDKHLRISPEAFRGRKEISFHFEDEMCPEGESEIARSVSVILFRRAFAHFADGERLYPRALGSINSSSKLPKIEFSFHHFTHLPGTIKVGLVGKSTLYIYTP